LKSRKKHVGGNLLRGGVALPTGNSLWDPVHYYTQMTKTIKKKGTQKWENHGRKGKRKERKEKKHPYNSQRRKNSTRYQAWKRGRRETNGKERATGGERGDVRLTEVNRQTSQGTTHPRVCVGARGKRKKNPSVTGGKMKGKGWKGGKGTREIEGT